MHSFYNPNYRILAYVDVYKRQMPEQKSGSIQVLSASLNQDFKLGIFHLDNEVTWQKSSDQTVLPLPDLSLYHNFYMQFKLAKKVLSVQLGADVRYFSKYNAPAYMPVSYTHLDVYKRQHIEPEMQDTFDNIIPQGKSVKIYVTQPEHTNYMVDIITEKDLSLIHISCP